MTDDLIAAAALAAESQSREERIEELIRAGEGLANVAYALVHADGEAFLKFADRSRARWDAALRRYREASHD